MPAALSVTDAVHAALDAWLYEDQTPEDINAGLCEEFALAVLALFPAGELDYAEDDVTGHTFVRWNGRCYDAECPDGVRDPLALPVFQRGS